MMKSKTSTAAPESSDAAPRKRGRRPKAASAPASAPATEIVPADAPSAPAAAPRKRGRRPKAASAPAHEIVPASAPAAPAAEAVSETATLKTLGTVVPAQLAEATENALGKLNAALGDDVDGFVASRLGFTPQELAAALAREQVEGVAMAIYNIEARSQSVIIGDQTGIGKGRQAAAMVRYGLHQGYLPIFFTDRYTLFSDMYRDCKALGIADESPLVLNQKVSVVDFDRLSPTAVALAEDEDWNLSDDDENDKNDSDAMALYRRQYMEVYSSPAKKDLEAMYAVGDLPEGVYSYIMVTYSQLKDARRDSTRLEFIKSLCRKHKVLFVFDEAHRSSSVSAGKLSVITESINSLLSQCEDTQCVFLSATFAKRPECMVTFMKQTMLASLATSNTLQKAFASGGVPMQEYVATMLANHGQMLRREQADYSNVSTTYTYLESSLERHTVLFDRVMRYFRAITELSRRVKDALTGIKDLGGEAFRAYPARQQLFYINKVLLFALKAADVAEAAVDHVRQGRSVVIAMSDTLECVLRDTIGADGACPRADFHALLSRLLEKTIRNPKDPSQTLMDLLASLNAKDDALDAMVADISSTYEQLRADIDDEQFSLPLSPIDVMRQLITAAKWKDIDGVARNVRFEECTGRARMLQYAHPNGSDDFMRAKVVARHKRHSNLIYNDFQNNKLDVILINATGAIGASAHATPTAEVDEAHVRQRVMLIVQNDLDVNLDLQKRGRINRTGQLESLPPMYEYIITAIPSEKRLNMMLRAKLRSLSANTTANQDQERGQADFIDITNRYGNQVAGDYLAQHPELQHTLDLNTKAEASQLLARAAMLSVAAQQELIDDIFSAYNSLEQELRRINQWDLEREFRDFEAEFLSEELFTSPVDDSQLGAASRLSRFMCRHRTYPLTAAAITAATREAQSRLSLPLRSGDDLRSEINAFYRGEYASVRARAKEREETIVRTYTRALSKVADEREVKDIVDMCANLSSMLANRTPGATRLKQKLLRFIHASKNYDKLRDQCETFVNVLATHYMKSEAALADKKDERENLIKILAQTTIGSAFYDISDVIGFEGQYDRVMAVLIDVRFGKNPARKFLPGQVQYVFALSAGPREVVLSLSQSRGNNNYEKVRAILNRHHWRFSAQAWDAEISRYNDRRMARYIITGNILGAYAHPGIADLTPRFINFSLKDSAVTEYGLLLPLAGEGLERILANVTLPLAEGIGLATSANVVYRITGLSVDFTLVCSRDGQGKLLYTLSVHESDGRTFEADQAFDSIRPMFTPSAGFDALAGRPSKKEAKRFRTLPMHPSSPDFHKIIEELAALRAVILIPRQNLTIGAEKRFNKRAVIDDSQSWPALAWREGPATPPARLAITRPEVEITPDDAPASELSPLAELAQETLLCAHTSKDRKQDFEFTLASLRDRWIHVSELTKDKEIVKQVGPTLVYFLRSAISDYRYFQMFSIPERIKQMLKRIVDGSFTDRVEAALSEFREKYVGKAPNHDELIRFLNSCPSDKRLDTMARRIQSYLSGDFPIVADV